MGRTEMIISEKDGILKVKEVYDFNIDHILDCGQCFRWQKKEDGSYSGIAFGRIVTVSYDDDTFTLKIDGADEEDYREIWCDYFDLDRDYAAIKKILAEDDPVMARAISYGQGIRILNQEKWETLLSFIISQNNNIPRIKKCIESLAETLGEKAGDYHGNPYYILPTPERLASATLEDLAPCRLGYRAKYLIETARQVYQEGIESLEILGEPDVSAAEALEALKKYSGVGPKVANCICLFSMRKFDSFPIDVWVKKVMSELYGIGENDTKGMADFAAAHFGQYGGIAQQYLFYYITHNKF